MNKLSDNYYKRICFLEREQVPSQSVIRKTMSPALAKVYFKSMTPKLKALAGLEPLLQGAGADWFVPPAELLRSRVVMKPTKKQYLSKLGFNGISSFGEKLIQDRNKDMEREIEAKLLENDEHWKKKIVKIIGEQFELDSLTAAEQNRQKMFAAYKQFMNLCRRSIHEIQNLMLDAGINEITRSKEEGFKKMHDIYVAKVKQQATELYDKYAALLTAEKEKLKAKFIEQLEISRTTMGNQLHDIKYEKHLAIEKLRNLLECQNLACQVYVALKEREECQNEMGLSKQRHEKRITKLKEQITMKDFEITLEKEKERKREEFIKIWQQKVCEVVKKFQMFVAYALSSLPEQAEFFMNMEKLMMLQLNEAMDNPDSKSIFEPETHEFHTPVARPHPFFLFCDKGFKPNLDQNYCPKHCTSSASQLPVIVVNKRCIYAACDNLDKFTDKVMQYIHGRRGDEKDFEDDADHSIKFPIQYNSSQRLQELKLESSLLQIIQSEMPNIRNFPLECCVCKLPYCFCGPLDARKTSPNIIKEGYKSPLLKKQTQKRYKTVSRAVELIHEREPKWDSYMDYVKPKKCKCSKMAKKHLEEHLPPYMRQMSAFDAPDLPNYEPCSVIALKKMVKKAQGRCTPPPPQPPAPPRTRDASTQCKDSYYDWICTCFSEQEITETVDRFLISDLQDSSSYGRHHTVAGLIAPSCKDRSDLSFVLERAMSLRKLVKDSPELEEIFRNRDCNYK